MSIALSVKNYATSCYFTVYMYGHVLRKEDDWRVPDQDVSPNLLDRGCAKRLSST